MHNNRVDRLFPIMALVLVVLAGCGQKGPLVLPDRPAKPKAAPAAVARPAEPTRPATSDSAAQSDELVH